MTTILSGLFVGGSIALATGGFLVHQLAVAVLIAAIVSGGSYWLLSRLAATVTGGTVYYRITCPTNESTTRATSQRESSERETSDESRLVDAQ
ncbi:hypothetical protein [Natrialba chahannaoensis]|uniref:hypothetical protein n=1 Tax=Natrialba chahannaoensis TaxID=68911 RepID=UPI000ADBF11B|nr:hypothetical protein [Natrialba chahannaoensis]